MAALGANMREAVFLSLIYLWFKVLKIRFLNWKDSSRQKLEEELERNSQQDTNEAQSALDKSD